MNTKGRKGYRKGGKRHGKCRGKHSQRRRFPGEAARKLKVTMKPKSKPAVDPEDAADLSACAEWTNMPAPRSTGPHAPSMTSIKRAYENHAFSCMQRLARDAKKSGHNIRHFPQNVQDIKSVGRIRIGTPLDRVARALGLNIRDSRDHYWDAACKIVERYCIDTDIMDTMDSARSADLMRCVGEADITELTEEAIRLASVPETQSAAVFANRIHAERILTDAVNLGEAFAAGNRDESGRMWYYDLVKAQKELHGPEYLKTLVTACAAATGNEITLPGAR